MNRHARFLLRENSAQQLFQEDMVQLPSGYFWMPELGLAKIHAYADNTQPLVDVHCLRPWNRLT